MNFFDELGEVISIKSKEVADKAKVFTDIASLRSQIATNENSILKKYREIGRQYYSHHKDDEAPEFHELIADIKAFEKSIDSLQEKINQLQGTIHCPNCDNDVPKDSAFCPKCGSRIEDKFYDDEDVVSDVATIEVIPIDDEVF